nr:hypothetical protein [Tanacetum cinerariifolium]
MEDEDEEQADGSHYFIQQYLLSLDITKKLQIMLYFCLRVSPLDKKFKGNIKRCLGWLLDSDIHWVIKANEDLPQEHHQFFLHQLLRRLKYLHTGTISCGPPPQNNNGPPPMATNFGLRHHMIQEVQNSCQFHGLPGDDANRHIDKFLEVTQHMKQNGVFDDALRLSLFPYSLMRHATAWYDRLPRNSIQSFDNMMRKFLSKYFPRSMNDMFYNGLTLRHQDTINVAAGGTFMKKRPEECYDLIENMIAHHNHWDTSTTRDETSRTRAEHGRSKTDPDRKTRPARHKPDRTEG